MNELETRMFEKVREERDAALLQIESLKNEQRLQVEFAQKILDAKDAWIQRATVAERLNGEYLKILKALEWRFEEAIGGPHKYCPACENRQESGHLEDCALGHAIHGAFHPGESQAPLKRSLPVPEETCPSCKQPLKTYHSASLRGLACRNCAAPV